VAEAYLRGNCCRGKVNFDKSKSMEETSKNQGPESNTEAAPELIYLKSAALCRVACGVCVLGRTRGLLTGDCRTGLDEQYS
jgi:hypothetical protein